MSIYTEAANSMPKLIRLECTTCGALLPINKQQMARNLQNGWPECCGYTMRLITENDLKQEANK